MEIKTLSRSALLLSLLCCSSQAQNDYKYRMPEKINDGSRQFQYYQHSHHSK